MASSFQQARGQTRISGRTFRHQDARPDALGHNDGIVYEHGQLGRHHRRNRLIHLCVGALLLVVGLGLLITGLSKRASCPAATDRWDFDRQICLSNAKRLYIPGAALLGFGGLLLLLGFCAQYCNRRRRGEQAFEAGFRDVAGGQQPLMQHGYHVPGVQPSYGHDGRPQFHGQQPMHAPLPAYGPPSQQYQQQPPVGYVYGQHGVAAPPQGYPGQVAPAHAPPPSAMPPAYAPHAMPAAYAPHVYTSDPQVAAQPEGVVAPPGGATSDEA